MSETTKTSKDKKTVSLTTRKLLQSQLSFSSYNDNVTIKTSNDSCNQRARLLFTACNKNSFTTMKNSFIHLCNEALIPKISSIHVDERSSVITNNTAPNRNFHASFQCARARASDALLHSAHQRASQFTRARSRQPISAK